MKIRLATKEAACKACRRKDRTHHAKGYCRACYQRLFVYWAKKNREKLLAVLKGEKSGDKLGKKRS